MTADNILDELSNERSRMIKQFMANFLGHEPTREEKRHFVCMHSLTETSIYYKGKLLGKLEYSGFDSFFA
jgi:hypothetical protein